MFPPACPNTMAVSATIFDFNGVLLWDSALHEEAWLATARLLRDKGLGEEEFVEHVHGRTNADIFAYVLGRPVQGEELLALTQTKESAYRKLCLDRPETFVLSPGAVPLLDWLHERDIPRTIATASEITNLHFFIEHLGLEKWFDPDLIVNDDGTFPGKPAPDMYLRAASRLGLPPERCSVVEDAVSGIRSAHAAGIGTIVALGPKERHPTLRSCPGVTRCVTDLSELFDEMTTQARAGGK